MSVSFTTANLNRRCIMFSLKTKVCLALAFALLLGSSTAVMANPTAGAHGGVQRAPAYGTVLHTIRYNAFERADFAVNGDGDTNLNVEVYDANFRLIVRTVGAGDKCHVNWTPNYTGTFYIYVRNSGSVWNRYNWRAY